MKSRSGELELGSEETKFIYLLCPFLSVMLCLGNSLQRQARSPRKNSDTRLFFSQTHLHTLETCPFQALNPHEMKLVPSPGPIPSCLDTQCCVMCHRHFGQGSLRLTIYFLFFFSSFLFFSPSLPPSFIPLLKTNKTKQKMYSLSVLTTGQLKLRCVSRAVLPLRSLGGSPPLPFPVSGDSWILGAPGLEQRRSSFRLHHRTFFLCVLCLHIQISLFFYVQFWQIYVTKYIILIIFKCIVEQ